LNYRFLSESMSYDGSNLKPHWVSEQLGLFGDGTVAYRGPCRVGCAELVDVEDRRAGASIAAKEMLHFQAEFFGGTLEEMILRQRLWIACFLELLRERVGPQERERFERQGNDLFFQDGTKKKLSVSIVTASPVSLLLHFAVNIDPTGAPVPAIGLNRWGIDAQELALAAMKKWNEELDSCRKARVKVLPR
jgi:uncharacterized protein